MLTSPSRKLVDALHSMDKTMRRRHILSSTVIIGALLAGPTTHAATDPWPEPSSPPREQFSIPLEDAMRLWKGDLKGMIDRRLIRVLTTYSKTNYFLDKAAQRGATYDIFRLFEEDLNRKLAKESKRHSKLPKVHVVFIPVARNELLAALAAGKGDIAAAGLTVTPQRRQLVDFASPIYPDVNEVVVTGPASPKLVNLDDLAGKEIFVRRSSSYFDSLMALNHRFAAQHKPAMIVKEAPDTLEDEDLIEMVSAGLIPPIVVDSFVADFWKQVFPRITVHHEIAVRTGGNIAWAIRKGNPQLKATLDDFGARNGKGSAMGNVILLRYLKQAKYVKDAASEAERERFLTMVRFFQKYGDQYDVDWLLMAAQGYQESQLNQAARSKVGAIGVMQVMPATGKELGVGNIHQVEPNIHAGIKYMRWMIDHYYAKEPMTELDKALFTFASYNAGIGRISALRKEAVRRGLNPNVWFHHVEHVAAEKMGAETVTYVANIYKYSIAYQLIVAAREEKRQATEKLKSRKP